jgi:phage terminase Nu1 subunit (DNA packaging protein)
MGVGVRTIDRFVAEGMPVETWGMRARRFLPSEAIRWARTRSSEEEGHLKRFDVQDLTDAELEEVLTIAYGDSGRLERERFTAAMERLEAILDQRDAGHVRGGAARGEI